MNINSIQKVPISDFNAPKQKIYILSYYWKCFDLCDKYNLTSLGGKSSMQTRMIRLLGCIKT